MKVLITSGGCKVPIDDVRHIGNFSSGRYGSELQAEFEKRGDDVIFFHEKGSMRSPIVYTNCYYEPISKRRPIEYRDYYEYLQVKDIIKREQPDIIISAAAISDYIVDKIEGKISSTSDEIVLRLRKGEKVIQSFRGLAPDALIVGFKLLVGPTEDEVNSAVNKVFDAGVDMVVYNDLLELKKGITERRLYYGVDRGKKGFAVLSVKELVDEIIMTKNLNGVLGK